MAEQPVNRRQERWGLHRTLAGTSVGKDWVMAGVWKTPCTRASRAEKSLATSVVCKSGRVGTDLCRNVKDTGTS